MLDAPVAVYNLEVAGAHTYFVEDGLGRQTPLWVHNDCGEKLRKAAGALSSPRQDLLNEAKDIRVRNAIESLYRPNARIGSGSTMDAVRFEKATGQLLSPQGHVQKVQERRSQLMKLLDDPALAQTDRRIVKRLLIDIQEALSR